MRATEEPYTHLSEYEATCGTIGGQGFTADEVKLVLFQFSLKDWEKQWFLSLLSASIATWAELQQQFLDEYFPPHKTNEAQAAIRDFKQQSREPFYEAIKRFKELLRNCPHHGIEKWELLQAFYDGLLSEDVKDVNATSAMTTKRQANASRRTKTGVTAKAVDYETQKRMDAMELQMVRLGRPSGRESKAEEVNQVGGDKKQDMNATHYHLGLRNHPNLRVGVSSSTRIVNKAIIKADTKEIKYQQQGNQQNKRENGGDPQLTAILESLKRIEQDREIQVKTNESFERQLGQLAEKIAEVAGRPPGQLPSDTKLNPQGSRNANVSEVSTLRSGKVYNKVTPASPDVEGVVVDLGEDGESDSDSEAVLLNKLKSNFF
ncbi:hypothetical protein L1987_43700 [Smallanthus sonchifolius]|uniref:Uncharacterized protein n=1 Tax=Smallanthus sonchifolius TaxID=185202 RepID=A0ACB9GM64_9ASTR|nr:hypothetical protein L1987_43700 [Smallanthus sonchifolius]